MGIALFFRSFYEFLKVTYRGTLLFIERNASCYRNKFDKVIDQNAAKTMEPVYRTSCKKITAVVLADHITAKLPTVF